MFLQRRYPLASKTGSRFRGGPQTLSYALISLFVLLHLALISSVGLGGDEAHYGLYALKLDWSYFDHPPMVGWLLSVGQIFGPSETGLRLIPLALMVLNSVLLLKLTQKVYPDSDFIPVVALALFHLSLITQLLGWGMIPDVPLMTFNLLTIFAVIRLRERFTTMNFAIFGLLIGLCGLTKYTAIVIPIALFSWLVLQRQFFNWLRQPGLWLAVLIAAVTVSPVFYWNSQHDWISFVFQMDHATGGEWKISNVLRMQRAQLLAFSPLVFVLGLVVFFSSIRSLFTNERSLSSHQRLLFAMGVVHLGLVAWSSGHGELLPHWGTLGWLMVAPLGAEKMVYLWQKKSQLIRISLGILAVVSIILWIFLFLLLGLKPVQMVKGSEVALEDLLGWKEAAEKAVTLASEQEVEFIWVENWSHTSRIAWYSQHSGLTVQTVDRKPNQFDLWNGEPLASQRAVLVTPNRREKDEHKQIDLENSQCDWLDELEYRYANVTVNHFNYYLCGPLSVRARL